MRRLPFLLLFVVFLTPLHAQADFEDLASRILQEALSIRVDTRVTASGGEFWENSLSKITVPGRSISLHLEGRNARLSVHLTPFPEDDDAVLLVAQSEIWLDEEDREGVDYYSSLKSIPVPSGETVRFFPLGAAEEKLDDTRVQIRMDITVVPYESLLSEEEKDAILGALRSSEAFDLTGDGYP